MPEPLSPTRIPAAPPSDNTYKDKNVGHPPDTTDLSRRQFVRLALLSSAALAGSPSLLAAQNAAASDANPAATEVPWHGPLRALPPGAVRPEGWLRTTLEKQAAQLGSHLPQISWPFTDAWWAEQQEGAFWTQEMEYEAWWPWEQKAYWIDGATRLGLLLQNDALLAQSTHPILYTFTHPDSEGYLGPELFQDPLGDYHRWPHNVFFRSACAVADAQHPLPGLTPAQIAAAMQRHYLTDTASYGKPKRNINNVEDILWCYAQTRDSRLLALAENAWREYLQVADDPENADLGAMRVFADTPIDAHGETYAETAKQPAILYLYTGRQDYLRFGLAAQRRIFDHHMLIDGVPSTSEWFGARTSLASHETCDIADHTWSWGYYLMATGDAAWADRVERACFNAAPGAIRNDWRALQYFSCPNQFLATLDSDHNWPKFKEHGGSMMAYQPNPGQRTACCGGNVHRIFPNYVIRMWMQTQDHGLAAVLLGPSTVRAAVGPDRVPVEIVQTTHYPFDETIRFQIHAERPVEFPLWLRIPAWCSAPRLRVNGTAVAINDLAANKGFAILRRTFRSGDEIILDLPMKVAVSRWPENGIGLERGPLVYSLPIAANWTTTVVPKYSTAEYPAYEARPISAWNYGLALSDGDIERAVTVEKQPLPEPSSTNPASSAAPDADSVSAFDPWEHPPIHLTVAAKKIEGWDLQSNPDKPEQKFTPCLPDETARQTTAEAERITLAPYGSTKLRLTIFPELTS